MSTEPELAAARSPAASPPAYSRALAAFCAGLRFEAIPADVVTHLKLCIADTLACGVFGNITDQDIEHTLAHCAQFCAHGATLIWTRHRNLPDHVPWICRRLEQAGFERQWLSDPDESFGVGVHRFTGQPQPLDPTARLFTFIGYDVLTQTMKPD